MAAASCSAMETLSETATLLRASLHKSQSIADSMASVLGSFDRRYSSVQSSVLPLQNELHVKQRVELNVDATLQSFDVVLDQFEVFRKAEAVLLREPVEEDLDRYIAAIDQLRASKQFFIAKIGFEGTDGVVGEIDGLLSTAMLNLEYEFKNLLQSYSDYLIEFLQTSLTPLGSPRDGGGKYSIDSNEQYYFEDSIGDKPEPPPESLRTLACQMVQGGCHQQVLRIYRETRSAALDTSLGIMGIERLSKDDIQRMQWRALKSKITEWMENMPKAVKLLKEEKQLCDHTLKDSETLRAQCFTEVIQNNVHMLFSFGDAFARSKISPEKMFVLLDMYEITRELMMETPYNEMQEHAKALTKRLAQTARETFGDFQEAVKRDSTRSRVLDGTIHPLTSYVVNYVKFLSDYRCTLKQLFEEFNEAGDPDSQLASATARLMLDLRNNLEEKSKQYKDPSLAQIFLMNNIHFIVGSVKRSEMKELLDGDWVARHRMIVRKHAKEYSRISSEKIRELITLTAEGRGSGVGAATPPRDDLGLNGSGLLALPSRGHSSVLPRAVVKDKFKNFNIEFEELHRKQSRWIVPDTKLRDELRLLVSEVIVRAYQSFYTRCRSQIEAGMNPWKYLKYIPEDVERKVSELFSGRSSIEHTHL